MAERQEAQLLVTLMADEALGHRIELEDDVAMRDHRTLRLAGRTRGIDQHADVVGSAAINLLVETARMGVRLCLAELVELVDEHHPVVPEFPETLAIENDDLDEARNLGLYLEELVELFVVFDDKETRSGVIDEIGKLAGRIRRVDAGRNCPGADCRHVEIEPFPVVLGKDRNDLAALEPQPDQGERNPFGMVAVVAP